jgi:hypothetical protein
MAMPAASATPTAPASGASRGENAPSGKFVAPPIPTARQAAWGLGLFVAFLLPFCAVGLWTGGAAIAKALAGDWSQAAFYALFCLVFGGAGFGLLTTVVLGRTKLRDTMARAAAHPDEPWLWRDDWAAKQASDGAQRGMWSSIFFAALWNLISAPLVVAMLRQELPRGNRLALLGLVFPVVGIALATWATRRTLQYRRFGSSTIDLERVPFPVGHRLVATVRARIETPPSDGFRVVLACINRRETGVGKDRSTTEYVLWQEEQRVLGTAVRDYRGAGTTVPVDFAIPADVRGTDESVPTNVIVWRVTVSASLPGVDYEAAFDVPVYYTADSARPEESDAPRFAAATPLATAPVASSITVTHDGDGTTIVVPAFRNPGATMSLAVFTILWTGTIWIQRLVGAPFIFPAVTGLVAVVLWWAVLEMAFGSRRAVVRLDGVAVTHRLLGIPLRGRVAAADVAGVEMPIQMQAGSTPYYSVLVRRQAIPGRRLAGAITVASGIRDKREAEGLVATITQILTSPH